MFGGDGVVVGVSVASVDDVVAVGVCVVVGIVNIVVGVAAVAIVDG